MHHPAVQAALEKIALSQQIIGNSLETSKPVNPVVITSAKVVQDNADAVLLITPATAGTPPGLRASRPNDHAYRPSILAARPAVHERIRADRASDACVSAHYIDNEARSQLTSCCICVGFAHLFYCQRTLRATT